jgi:hypothetical protein
MHRFSKKGLRGLLFASYFLVTFIVLVLFTWDDVFCARPAASNHWLATSRLALALAVYGLVVSLAVGATLSPAPGIGRPRWTSTLVAALVVGLGVACLPYLIYQGHGHFRFEGTWADVSCFFIEANGLMFPFLVAPVLAIATFLQEIAILKFSTPD